MGRSGGPPESPIARQKMARRKANHAVKSVSRLSGRTNPVREQFSGNRQQESPATTRKQPKMLKRITRRTPKTRTLSHDEMSQELFARSVRVPQFAAREKVRREGEQNPKSCVANLRGHERQQPQRQFP